ncbi:hypothetical protein GBAR_LOCUS3500 [Geodia barretti]|uniref:Uncharacterized protein n=1 Tax=Geodia barretti TaxID=519541 RepID=A0AA35W0Z0_GEOBA|nr:hypothetical protein GBAR_LOCUS3500 [Geodia barretti]
MTTVEEMQYEKTLMYGRYSELQRFASEFAASRRTTPHQPPDIEEALKKKLKTYKIRRYFSEKILPYMVDWLFILVLGISMAFLSFVIDYLIDVIGQGMCT